jgi:hypothetical protein
MRISPSSSGEDVKQMARIFGFSCIHFKPSSHLAHSSTLKMEVTLSYETSAHFQRIMLTGLIPRCVDIYIREIRRPQACKFEIASTEGADKLKDLDEDGSTILNKS